MANVRWRQTKILLRKNFILIKRNYKATIIQLVVPFIFVFFLWILQFGIKANDRNDESLKVFNNPQPNNISSVPRCIIGPKMNYCYTLAYVTNTDIGDYVVGEIKRKNNIPDNEIRKFQTSDELDVYIDANHNSTTAAVVFNLNATDNSLHYSLQHNKTVTYVESKEVRMATYLELPWINALEYELTKNVTSAARPINFNFNFIEYAHPELVIQDVVGQMGPTFFFAALMFNVVIQLSQIVLEKEMKLREGMNMMGLKDSVYWFTWTVTNVLTNTISSLILTASGYIFQLDFFKRNDFPTFFFLFLLFGISMVTFVFFLSTIIKRSDIATSIGFVIFLIGIIIQSFASLAFQESFYPAVRIILSLLPFALLGKGIQDLSDASAGSTAHGLRWSQRSTNAWFSLNDVYGWLIFDFFFFLVIALYLDNVVASMYGTSKPPYFFLMPSYWSSKPAKPSPPKPTKKPKNEIELDEEEDEDVVLERENVLSGNLSATDTAVKIVNLRKIYKSSKCCGKSKEFVAVKGTCLSIGQGQLFVLLGHNGAGKTTTFNMMTGLFSPSSGDAFVFGNSIISNMSEIRKNMGVCPQHDILFQELTGREHLEIFAAFKGVQDSQIPIEVAERLKDVELTSAADVPCGKYSGGMRRRLSTAIALIADPKIVYLDEPTTGMDVVSRRSVWNLIQKVKRGRVIILTTHSMEEADVLGDRIGIMKKGKLVCLGTPLRLKNKFGAGYKLTILYDAKSPDAQGLIQKFFTENIALQPTVQSVGMFEYNVPRDQTTGLMDFFDLLEQSRSSLSIKDIQIRMTTLEEVFLTISGHEE